MNKPARYTKLPITIEAMEWDGTAKGANAIIDWALSHDATINYSCDLGGDGLCPEDEAKHYLVIRTLEGDMVARSGYWIIKGVEGEFYGCEPEIFAKTYGPEKRKVVIVDQGQQMSIHPGSPPASAATMQTMLDLTEHERHRNMLR